MSDCVVILETDTETRDQFSTIIGSSIRSLIKLSELYYSIVLYTHIDLKQKTKDSHIEYSHR